MKFVPLTTIFLSMILCHPFLLRADEIFDNLGEDNSFSTFSGLTIGGSNNTEYANQFEIGTSNFFLDSVEIAASFVSGTNELTVSLWDSLNDLPNNELESVTLPILFQNGDPDMELTEVFFSGNSVLFADQTYFIALRSDNDGSSMFAWNFATTQSGSLPKIRRQNGGSWESVIFFAQPGGLRVFGSPVPEPSSMVVLIGVSLITINRRHKQI